MERMAVCAENVDQDMQRMKNERAGQIETEKRTDGNEVDDTAPTEAAGGKI